jgi:AcrR family transcriptional regulator
MSPARRDTAVSIETEGRGARRREETRSKLVRAAREVMGRNGVGATTIQAITDAADVGFGSFYNHFASKEDIVAAVMDEAVESFGAAADQLADRIADPAEVLAASVRHAIRRAAADEAWGWFLVRTALARGRGVGRGLGPRLARDIRNGVESKRFAIDDPVAAVLAAGGAVLAVIAAQLHGDIGDDAAERAAAVVLRLLGISAAEAREIAHRRLPPIDTAGPRKTENGK